MPKHFSTKKVGKNDNEISNNNNNNNSSKLSLDDKSVHVIGDVVVEKATLL
jgi:hypothetical protein